MKENLNICSVIVNLFCEQAEKFFGKRECPYDISEEDDRIVIYVDWGDWKHDHGYVDNVMREAGYIGLSNVVTESDGSDCYCAIHEFAKEKGKYRLTISLDGEKPFFTESGNDPDKLFKSAVLMEKHFPGHKGTFRFTIATQEGTVKVDYSSVKRDGDISEEAYLGIIDKFFRECVGYWSRTLNTGEDEATALALIGDILGSKNGGKLVFPLRTFHNPASPQGENIDDLKWKWVMESFGVAGIDYYQTVAVRKFEEISRKKEQEGRLAALAKIRSLLENEGGLVPFSEHVSSFILPEIKGSRCWGLDLAKEEVYVTPSRKGGPAAVGFGEMTADEIWKVASVLEIYLTANY